ncbi:hypothetical protein U737_14890 [Methylomonas sp. LW13]|uniref:hypothetical protein n=1 Tax=unclassified Methylomonas TaxID=2608980 RepID=UPI00051C101C|nr:hypothetical protein [Methylomonas sp. LW13]QBC28077.1 hypothetical protein U737_14890 [Methylomonas sp. LW13]
MSLKIRCNTRWLLRLTTFKKRNTVFLFLACFLFVKPAQADSLRTDIYRQSLAKIASMEVSNSKDKHVRLVVMDTLLSALDMTREKVPRHDPMLQFTRNIPGVTAELELSLMYFNFHERIGGTRIEKGREGKLEKSEPLNDLKPLQLDNGVEYLGIMNQTSLATELNNQEKDKAIELVSIVKFSEIGRYLDKNLVYAEVVSPESGSAGGYGLLFKIDSKYGKADLIMMKPLWAGSSAFSFWP